MTDAVFVTGLSLHAYHGVMQHEGRVGQTFSLDLVLDTDLTEASRSDKLADTVGYDQVVEIATKAFGARRYRLVEAAATQQTGPLDEASRLLAMLRSAWADIAQQLPAGSGRP